MFIFIQGDSKVKKHLGIKDNVTIEVEPTKRAKDNEFVFYKRNAHGGMGFKRYKKVKHLECKVYAIIDIWGENTKKILKHLDKS